MRQRRKITTDKLHEVYIVFHKPTPDVKFKKSKTYKDIIAFIQQNDYLLHNEAYQSIFDPVTDDPKDYVEEPDFYVFKFLVKKHATAVAKAFKTENKIYKLVQGVLDTEGECWWTWPDLEYDPGDPGDSFMPDEMSFDDCMEIYGDIPGDRG